MTARPDRLAILSDEVSLSFAEAVGICLPLGIRAYELRSLRGGRIPHVNEDDIGEVIAQQQAHSLTLIGVSPGFCKCPVDDRLATIELTDGLDAVFRLMDRLAVRRITVFSYTRTSRDAPLPPLAIEHLRRVAARCRAHGVELLIENSASSWGDTGVHLAEVAGLVGARVTWDPANAQAAGERAYPDGYAHVRHLVAHVHCKNWLPGHGWVAINEGLVDWPGQLAALQADHYGGYLCIEPHQWNDRANAARNNIHQLLTMLRMLPQPMGQNNA